MKIQYNSKLILTYFFTCLFVFILNKFTIGKTNKWFFSTYPSSIINPLTYFRLIGHSIGHDSLLHFTNNFMYILLIGPLLEEKFGSMNLLLMMIITSLVIGLFNNIFTRHILLGSSGIVYMFITLSSGVNIQNGHIPLTMILICIFYVVNEISNLFLEFASKSKNVSHFSHLLGAVCGIIFCFIKF